MLARCVQKTKTATATLIAKIGDRGPIVTPISTGRSEALMSDPTDT